MVWLSRTASRLTFRSPGLDNRIREEAPSPARETRRLLRPPGPDKATRARAPGLSPARRGRWQGQGASVSSSAAHYAIKQPRAVLKRVKRGRSVLKEGMGPLLSTVLSRYAFIAAGPAPGPGQFLYRVLGGSPAGSITSGGKSRPPCLPRGRRRRKRPLRTTPDATAPGGCGPSYTL